MANLNKLLLAGQFPPGNNSLNHFEKLFGQALFGGVEKTVDFSPIISVSDALAKPVVDLQCKITAVQEGSGDPSLQNIRNIVGFSELSLYQTDGTAISYNAGSTTALNAGVDITVLSSTAFEMESTGVSQRYPASKQLLSGLNLTNGKAYTIYAYIDIKTIMTKNLRFGIRDANNTFVSGKVVLVYDVLPVGEDKGLIALRFTYDSTTDNYLSLVQFKTSSNAEPLDIVLSQIKVLEDTTSDTPTEYPVTWQTEAGTVYGGIRDITTGVLTVEWVSFDMGLLEWDYNTNYNYPYYTTVTTLSGVTRAAGVRAVMCECYKAINNINASTMRSSDSYDGCICINSGVSNPRLILQDLNITDINDFQTAIEGKKCICKLVTPQTYQLTPQEVQMLAGNNTIWNTAGDTALTYMAKKG